MPLAAQMGTNHLLAPGGKNGLKSPFSPWRQKWAQITF